MPVSTTASAPPVLFLLSSVTSGGSETKTVRLANTLAARGRRVIVAYLELPDRLVRALDPAVESVDLQRRGKFSVGALLRLVRLVRRRGVSVMVAINLYPALYAYLATWLLRGPRRHVIAWVNTTEFGSRKESAQMRLYRRVLNRLDLVLFGAESQRKLWCERYAMNDSNERCAVLYNGVDAVRFSRAAVEPLAAAAAPETRFLVGTVGRLAPEKAHVHLVRAVADLRTRGLDVGALIVGAGPERAQIEAEIRHARMEPFVRIVGESADVRPYLARMQIFVLCSVAVETFSNATLEAMAMGCPVVSARVGGMEEMLRWGGGLTYPAGDVAALTQALSDLLDDSPRLAQMSSEARNAAVTHFSWSQMVSEMEACIQRVSCGTPASRSMTARSA